MPLRVAPCKYIGVLLSSKIWFSENRLTPGPKIVESPIFTFPLTEMNAFGEMPTSLPITRLSPSSLMTPVHSIMLFCPSEKLLPIFTPPLQSA